MDELPASWAAPAPRLRRGDGGDIVGGPNSDGGECEAGGG